MTDKTLSNNKNENTDFTVKSYADRFEDALEHLRHSTPLVGTSALAGKTANTHLHNSWSALNEVGVKLERGSLNYMWGDLRRTNPKLAHTVEEVLIFGDALFTAISRRQSPESLRDEFIDVKQRFAKVIKETEEIASPKEERKLFSFFSQSNEEQGEKTALRLDNLDELLNQAHDRSKSLLEKTEKDLFIEKAFQDSVGSYVLALEEVQSKLDKESAPGGELSQASAEIIAGLKTALVQSISMTKNNFAISKSHLQTKSALHDASISFLTMHENTFTFIQGQLHALGDIKKLTDTMNSLSDVVSAGSSLASSASVGVESAIIKWNEPFVSQDTLKKLSSGFENYDNTISNLITKLTPENQDSKSTGPVLSHWDNLDEVKKDLIEPILKRNTQSRQVPAATRPTRRRQQDVKIENDSYADFDYSDKRLPREDKKEGSSKIDGEEEIKIQSSVLSALNIKLNNNKPWDRLEKLSVQQKINEYNELVGSKMDVSSAMGFGWSAMEAMSRFSVVTDNLKKIGIKDFATLPFKTRSRIDYICMFENPSDVNWGEVVNEKALSLNEDNWKDGFLAWHEQYDDLDYSYIMQWNELVYDLLILEEDEEQKKEVLQSTDHQDIKASLVKRIEEFASNPGLSTSQVRQWSFSGLILRYGVELGVSVDKLKPIWDNWHNKAQPVDWDDSNVISGWESKVKNKDHLNLLLNEVKPKNNEFYLGIRQHNVRGDYLNLDQDYLYAEACKLNLSFELKESRKKDLQRYRERKALRR